MKVRVQKTFEKMSFLRVFFFKSPCYKARDYWKHGISLNWLTVLVNDWMFVFSFTWGFEYDTRNNYFRLLLDSHRLKRSIKAMGKTNGGGMDFLIWMLSTSLTSYLSYHLVPWKHSTKSRKPFSVHVCTLINIESQFLSTSTRLAKILVVFGNETRFWGS